MSYSFSSWSRYYENQVKTAGSFYNYYLFKLNQKSKLIKVIVNHTYPKGKILEVGCGTGILSMYLAKSGYHTIGLDNDTSLIELVNDFNQNVIKSSAKFLIGDAFKLNYDDLTFDTVISHGLLEHFPDEEILMILKEMLRVAKIAIVSFPSNYFNDKSMIFGNERFLPLNWWVSFLLNNETKILYKFGFSYKNKLLKLINLILPTLTIKFAPHIGFVLCQGR